MISRSRGGGGGIGQSVWKCEKGGGGPKEKWSHTLAKNLKQTLSLNFFFLLWYENIRFEKYLGKGATGVFDGSKFFLERGEGGEFLRFKKI